MSLGEIAGLADAALRTWMWFGGRLVICLGGVALARAGIGRAWPLRWGRIGLAMGLLVVGFVLQLGPAFLEVHGLPPKAPGRL